MQQNSIAQLEIDWAEFGEKNQRYIHFAKSPKCTTWANSIHSIINRLQHYPNLDPCLRSHLFRLLERLGFTDLHAAKYDLQIETAQGQFAPAAEISNLLEWTGAFFKSLAERLNSINDIEKPTTKETATQALSLDLLSALDGVNLCAQGNASRLQEFILACEKNKTPKNILQTFISLKENIFKEAINKFYHNKSSVPQELHRGNHIHYVAAAKNILGEVFGLYPEKIQDSIDMSNYVTQDMSNGLNIYLKENLSTDVLLKKLAEQFINELKENLTKDGVTLPFSHEMFSDNLEKIQFACSQLSEKYGDIDSSLVLDINNDNNLINLQSQPDIIALKLLDSINTIDNKFNFHPSTLLEIKTPLSSKKINQVGCLIWMETNHGNSKIRELFDLNELMIHLKNISPDELNDVINTEPTKKFLKKIFYQAIENKKNDITNTLFKMGVRLKDKHFHKTCNLFIASINNADIENVKIALSAGVSPNLTNEYNIPALAFAASKGYTEIAKVLIEANADVNYAVENNITPLIFAASEGNFEIVKLLVTAGADVKIKTSEGLTAFDYANQKEKNLDIHNPKKQAFNEIKNYLRTYEQNSKHSSGFFNSSFFKKITKQMGCFS